jgi:hypothetical protein
VPHALTLTTTKSPRITGLTSCVYCANDQPMNLLLSALLVAVERAADGRGLESFRVKWKFNAAGELVVAVIVRDSRLTEDRVDPTANGYRAPKAPR